MRMSPSEKKSSPNRPQKKQKGQMQETAVPSRKVSRKEMTMEAGGSGTNLLAGQIIEDYNGSLLGTLGLEVYDKMRKSDAQVHATLMYCELPILSTKWSIEPAKNKDGVTEEEDEEVAEFVRQALFEHQEKTWTETLREILTMLPFGHSVFELVWEVVDDQVWLKKLGWRKPTTIQRWETQDGAAGITQVTPQGKIASIPAEKLLIFSLRREGDNYEGTSVLRTAYRHWYLKDKFYRFDAVRHERQSLGILKIKLPVDASPDDEAKALTIIRNIRNVEQAGITVPGGTDDDAWEAEFMDMKAGTTSNLEWSINHHDRKIATNILAQFMELGSEGGSGSYALSEDQSSLFLLADSAVAVYIRDTINRFLIKKLVDYNFDVERYPSLKFEKLGDVKITDFASAIGTLAGAGMITADKPTEAAIREKVNLPAQSEEVMDGEMEDEGLEDDAYLDIDEEEEEPNGDDEDMSLLDDEEEDAAELSEDDVVDLSEVFFSQLSSIAELGEDHVIEVLQLASGAPVSSQTKQKISDALKAYWDRRGRKTPDAPAQRQKPQTPEEKRKAARVARNDAVDTKRTLDTAARRGVTTKELLQNKDALVRAIEQARKQIDQISGQYKSAIDAAKTTAEKKKLRAERKAILTPLKQIRSQDISTRVNVNKILRARRKELAAKVKAIRTALKEKRIDLKSAIAPLKTEVQSNNAKVKELRARAKGMKGEAGAALKAAIAGLLEDNQSIRDTAASMRDEFGKVRDAANAEIDKTKQESGFLSEAHQPPGHGEFFELSQLLNNRTIIELQNEMSPLELSEAKKKGLITNDFEKKAFRPLTLSERKVNWGFLEKSMNKGTAALAGEFAKAIGRAKSAILEQVKFAVKYNDVSRLSKVKVPKDVRNAMAQALTDVQKDMFDDGKFSAARELGVQVPPTKAEVKGAIRVQNDSIVAKIVSDLENAAKQAATEAIQKTGAGSITDTTQKDAVMTVQEALDGAVQLSEEQQETFGRAESVLGDAIALAESTANTLSVTGSINMGRSSVFDRYPEQIYGYQFSAILDGRTTAICMSLDGIVVKPYSSEYYDYIPPRHRNCRSIYVAILMTETFKPEFTSDISSSIPTDISAMNTSDLKAPVVGEHTSQKTIDLIQQDIADRQAKVKQYSAEGKFQNRIDVHKDAIKTLEKGLRGAPVETRDTFRRSIQTEDGEKISTPTGYVYGLTDKTRKAIEKSGIDGGIVVSPAAAIGEGTIFRVPSGKAASKKPVRSATVPEEMNQFIIENDIEPAIIEVWDDARKEWIPAMRADDRTELKEVVKAIMMCEGILFTTLAKPGGRLFDVQLRE